MKETGVSTRQTNRRTHSTNKYIWNIKTSQCQSNTYVHSSRRSQTYERWTDKDL